jgi:hypothetical protein
MSRAQDHYRQATDRVLRELLRAVLGGLPETGWTGTAAELSEVFRRVDAARGGWGHIPSGSGVSKMLTRFEPVIRQAGFRLAFRRTARTRFIVLAPAGGDRADGQPGRGRRVPSE